MDSAKARGLARRWLALAVPGSQDHALADQLSSALERHAPDGPAAVVAVTGNLFEDTELSVMSHQVIVVGDDAVLLFVASAQGPSISVVRVPDERFGLLRVDESLDPTTGVVRQTWHFRGERDAVPFMTHTCDLSSDRPSSRDHNETLAVVHALAARLGWARHVGPRVVVVGGVVGEAPPDRGYLELLEQLSRAKGHIANLVTRKKRLQMRQASLRAALDAHVKRPLPPGNEEMTRAAQEFKQGLEAQLETLGRRIAELQALQEKLIESEHAVRLRVADSHTNSEVDHAHRSATAALADISDAAATVGQQIAHGDPDDPTPPIQDVTVTEQ